MNNNTIVSITKAMAFPVRPAGAHWKDGYLYVVLFDDSTIKIGRTSRPDVRLRAHKRDGEKFGIGIERWWVSPIHRAYEETESELKKFAASAGELQGGSEYFTNLDFNAAVHYAGGLDAKPSTPEQIASDDEKRQETSEFFANTFRQLAGPDRPRVFVGNEFERFTLSVFFDEVAPLPEMSGDIPPELEAELLSTARETAASTGRDPEAIDQWTSVEWLHHLLDMTVKLAKLRLDNRVIEEGRADYREPWLVGGAA